MYEKIGFGHFCKKKIIETSVIRDGCSFSPKKNVKTQNDFHHFKILIFSENFNFF
jgi:hypothetical protein